MLTVICIIGLALLWTAYCAWRHARVHGKAGRTNLSQHIDKIIRRCRELNLRLTESESATKVDFMVFLTVQTMNYLHSGRHRVAL